MSGLVAPQISRFQPAAVLADPAAVAPAAPAAVGVPAAPRGGGVKQSFLFRVLRHLAPTSWAYFDFVLATGATCLSHRLLLSGNPSYAWVFGPWLSGLVFGGCIMVAGLVFGLYEQRTLSARSRILVRSMLTLCLGLVLAYACIFLLFYGSTSRLLLLLVALEYAVIALPVRLLAHEAVVSHKRRALCVGSEPSVRKLIALLDRAWRPHVHVIGHVSVPGRPSDLRDTDFLRRCPHLGSLGQMQDVLTRHRVDEVIVAAELASDADVGRAVLTCLERHCRVTDQPTFVEKLLGEVPAESISAQWFLLADVRPGGGYETAKRLLDLAAAGVGLVLTLPVWPLIALAIRLDGAGPVLFTQRRVGLHGRPFTICKFRTMRVDAERDGARWADRNDPRVTRVGRFLRLTRLDELPQLWNVLRGDMSLVGPRPERPEFVEQLSHVIPHYRERHLIKPGLTGWAQIHLGYGATVEDARRKLCFDLYYLKHRSVDLDFAILIRTLGTFLLGAR